MFLTHLNAEIVACILIFRKSRHKRSQESTPKYGFSPDLAEKNGGALSMRMQVTLDSFFARPGSAPIGGGKKGEFKDWTIVRRNELISISIQVKRSAFGTSVNCILSKFVRVFKSSTIGR